jgi:hypothetical protein
MEDVMEYKFKSFRRVAIVGLALLAVPVAQAKPISFSHVAKQQQGETALGLKVDGLRLQAQAQAYADSQEIRSQSLAEMRDAKATSRTAAATGFQKHYPFANENTAAFQVAEQSANSGSAPISENSPVVQRLQTTESLTAPQSSPAPISENSPVQLRLHPSSPVTVPASGSSFDWTDAGIGAGLAALLTAMLALGAGTAISRKRVAHV